MLFISCRSITSQIQLYNYEYSNQVFIVLQLFQKHVDTYYFNIFRVQIIHSYYSLKYNYLLQ